MLNNFLEMVLYIDAIDYYAKQDLYVINPVNQKIKNNNKSIIDRSDCKPYPTEFIFTNQINI